MTSEANSPVLSTRIVSENALNRIELLRDAVLLETAAMRLEAGRPGWNEQDSPAGVSTRIVSENALNRIGLMRDAVLLETAAMRLEAGRPGWNEQDSPSE